MVTVNVHEAETHLSRLLAQVASGEDVVIARNGKPVVRLVSVTQHGKRQSDVLKGRITIPDSFSTRCPRRSCDCGKVTDVARLIGHACVPLVDHR